MMISLVAKVLTTGEVQAHLAEIYGAQVSRDTISAITDRVLDGLAEWQSRPLDAVYAVLFLDAIYVKIRDGQVANRPVYVALGVTADGERDILGLWAGEHGDGWAAVARDLKPIYTAASQAAALDAFAAFSGTWEARRPAIVRLWESAWAEFVPFLAFDTQIRTLITTTHAIESLNARFRRSVKARGHFPTEQAAPKHLYLVIISPTPPGKDASAGPTGGKAP